MSGYWASIPEYSDCRHDWHRRGYLESTMATTMAVRRTSWGCFRCGAQWVNVQGWMHDPLVYVGIAS